MRVTKGRLIASVAVAAALLSIAAVSSMPDQKVAVPPEGEMVETERVVNITFGHDETLLDRFWKWFYRQPAIDTDRRRTITWGHRYA